MGARPALAPLSLLLLLCAPRAQAAPVPIQDGVFVRAEGTRFMAGDRPFVFVGANFNPMHGEQARASYKETLAALSQDGLTVGRVWALGEGPADATAWQREHELLRAGPEGFIEAAYVHLDHVLAEARARGIRVILTLSNHWSDYGGIPMYLRWAGLLPQGSGTLRPGGKDDIGLAFEQFYRDERARTYYRAGLLRLLGRTNTVSGVRYVDDPTIFSWELMNESAVMTRAGTRARRRWIAEMAGLIKTYDPHHMVGAGLFGYTMRAERAEWIAVHRLPSIDYCDSHLYPQGSDGAGSWARLRDLIDDRAQLALHVVGKPLLIGEFGFLTDGPRQWLGAPRAEWFRRLVERVLEDGGGGALAWIYEPFSGHARDYGIYTDRPDTDDVRAALRELARRAAAADGRSHNPRLSASRGDALLYEATVRVSSLRGERPHGAWQSDGAGWLLRISPDEYAEGRFERAGSWAGGTFLHAYGADTGSFRYRFTAPPLPAGVTPAALTLLTRVSSEWPGTAAPPDGGSLVDVLLDGHPVGRWQAIPDNGIGRAERLRVDDPRLLRALAAGTHTLTFQVPEGENHGLCIYGPPTGKPPPPPPLPPDQQDLHGPDGGWPPILLRYVVR